MDDLTTSAQQLSLTSGVPQHGMAAAQGAMVPAQTGYGLGDQLEQVQVQQAMEATQPDAMDIDGDETALACEQFQQSTALSDMIARNQARTSSFNNQLAMVVGQEKNNGQKMKVAVIKHSMVQEDPNFQDKEDLEVTIKDCLAKPLTGQGSSSAINRMNKAAHKKRDVDKKLSMEMLNYYELIGYNGQVYNHQTEKAGVTDSVYISKEHKMEGWAPNVDLAPPGSLLSIMKDLAPVRHASSEGVLEADVTYTPDFLNSLPAQNKQLMDQMAKVAKQAGVCNNLQQEAVKLGMEAKIWERINLLHEEEKEIVQKKLKKRSQRMLGSADI